MAIKPVSLSAVLGNINPNTLRDPGIRRPDNNRFAILRDRSNSAGSFPPLSPAAKRPFKEVAQDNGKRVHADPSILFKAMESAEIKLRKGKDSVDQLKVKLVNCPGVDNSLKELLGGFVDLFDNVFGIMEELSSITLDKSALAAATPARSRAGSRSTPGLQVNGAAFKVAAGGEKSVPILAPAPTAAEIRKRKFVNAVKEAEKSVLIFKLNLGSVPIMNTGTIARKVTEGITAKAAAVEGKTNGRPSDDTVTMLEDTLSMVKGMEFFGKVTKPFSNKSAPQDPENGKYCTIPVKMAFKDKDSKVRAETVLRTTCKLQCSTPYPLKLRQVIKETIAAQKAAHPEEFIQVRVDAENGMLKISRKVGGRLAGKWHNNVDVVTLTDEVMDMGAVSNSAGENMETETVSGEESAL